MKTLNLFENQKSIKKEKKQIGTPLADLVRPDSLDGYVGQEHILNQDSFLYNEIKNDNIGSVIFWGPPGCGKTTLAKIISKQTKKHFQMISAVTSGVADLKSEINKAQERLKFSNLQTIVFIDEIHRFNKSQQDILLPFVENGTIVLIGATTENPSFAINNALLSRMRVFTLHTIEESKQIIILKRAIDSIMKDKEIEYDLDVLNSIAHQSDGDLRRALNLLESSVKFLIKNNYKYLDKKIFEKSNLSSKHLSYDKTGEEHYNVISAFIKSMRGSDPDASIYYMMRMIEGGEDPLFILRRMVIFASEDIGNADPNAIQVATSCDTAFQRLGMPEGIYPLSQCCLYLSCAPKSNSVGIAFSGARSDIKKYGSLPVPLKLRNAPTKLMKEFGYGDNYKYPHSEGGYLKNENYLPEELLKQSYFQPTNNGYEKEIKKHMEKIRNI